MDEGLVCIACREWFSVWHDNVPWVRLQFCPLCGHEFTEKELTEMKEEQKI